MPNLLIVLLLVTLPLWSVQTKERKLEHVILQLHWKYNYSFAGFIMAKEKGFYKDMGLDVELKEYTIGQDIENDVLCGKANYGIYNSKILLDYLRGKPLKLLASFFKRSALVLVAQPEIKSVKDLKGKIIMGGTKKDFVLNFQPYFAKYGLSVDDVKLIPHTYRVKEFVEGKVDAMTAFTSNEIPKLQELGKKYTLLDPSDDNLFVMQLELFTSQSEFNAHPKRTKDFVKASIKGWEYVFAHPKETIKTLYTKYNRGYTREDLQKQAEAIEHLVLPYTYEIGSIDRSFLKKQARLFSDYYHLSPRSLEGYFYDPYASSNVELTFAQMKYIQKHPVIPVCVHYDLFPIDGYENGKETGIMGDIFNEISKRTGLYFLPVKADSFKKTIENIKQKKCQILSIATPKISKELDMYATKVFMKTYFTILTSIDRSFVKNSYTLRDKTLLIKDPKMMEYLKALYPYLHFKVMTDSKKMVEAIVHEQAYGIVTLDEQADYFIDQYGFGKLKIGGFLAKQRPIEGVIAINKDDAILASIIQKSVDSLSPSEIRSIVQSWHMTRYHKQVDYRLIMQILGVVALILLVMYYYQRKIQRFNLELERKVDEKTKELRELNEKLEALVKEKVEEIVQKDRLLAMQSKQAIMGEMITMIAHQWRQPLNTLTLQISNLQLRRMTGELVDIEEYDKTLEQISKTITYLSETIDDFQTFFHPDRKLSKANLKELVEKAVNFIRPRLKGTGIGVEINIDQNIELNVYVNELIQVLLNILNNAIDALLECEKEEKRISIYVQVDTDVKIFVQDTACGIDEGIIERLFEPYFSTKGKNGTGLGLYMSQMIIQKQFGGDIRVETSKVGSTFVIEFPKL